ncbi:phosphoglycerate mutase [Sphingobium sp. TA15]|uniref:Putative phosphoglycerate mutase n=1 Tax=Sphingobium indicum (strain DSM 16413 / CCM 7287 / MTCC 6362 / UT26 / NBRC 101211 / UT26S) TaxID=452662 RepID=D4Z016_SPHIU|nr:histidine phosphatase family protein [Sphingobium indicum]BAI95948.1 putative phosphoglycerate mutase [Sphingobium indicum UT26S]BDD65261.1 phosphoglycerate mutase [Sphingobium sp. TA15]
MLMLSSSREPPLTCFHLIRHGMHGEYGRLLSGRAGMSPLTARGRVQAAGVAAWRGLHAIDAIHASPRRRTVETASIIAQALGLEVVIAPDLDEVDFGSWNGRSFPELEQDPRWRDWNRSRSTSATPGGETMGGAVARTVRHLETVARENTGATILCVTHCDIIRGTIAHYLGLSLDNLLRFEVDPGSISTILLGSAGGSVTRLNEVPA